MKNFNVPLSVNDQFEPMLYQWYQFIFIFQAVCLTSANACFSSDPSTSFAGHNRNRRSFDAGNKRNSSDNQKETQIDYHDGGYGFTIDHAYSVSFDSSDSKLMNFCYSQFMNDLARVLTTCLQPIQSPILQSLVAILNERPYRPLTTNNHYQINDQK